MIDLNPLTLEETQKYWYGTYRANYEDLHDELQIALRNLTKEVVADYEGGWGKATVIQECLDKKLERFNSYSIKHYTRGILATATVKGLINSDKAYDFDIWVEFTGLTQKQMDELSFHVKAAVLDSYMPNHSHFAEKCAKILFVRKA